MLKQIAFSKLAYQNQSHGSNQYDYLVSELVENMHMLSPLKSVYCVCFNFCR